MPDIASRKLGLVTGLRWTLASSRWAPWLPALIMLVTPEMLAIGLEGRVAVPWRQYLGVFPGDVLLSFAVGASFWLAIHHLKYNSRRWYQSRAWHTCSMLFGLGFAGSVFYGELQNTLHRYVPSAAYTVAQFVSPTNLFHYCIIAVVSYLLWAVTLPTLVHARGHLALKVLIILAIVGWGICAIYLDNTLSRPDLADVHGTWFGGWWSH